MNEKIYFSEKPVQVRIHKIHLYGQKYWVQQLSVIRSVFTSLESSLNSSVVQ